MADLTIYVKFIRKIVEVEPDGSECEQCGEICFLRQYEAGIWIEGKPKPTKVWTTTCCMSCEPCVREMLSDIEDDS